MTQLIRIGNSQGVRIPKALIQQAHLAGHSLEFKVVKTGLLLKPIKKAREGWEQKINQAISQQDEVVDNDWLDATLTDDDWEW